MHTQQGPPVWHRELFSVLCGSVDGSGVWGRVDTCIHMAESLHYSPETITTLLFGHTPTQNKKFLKRERERGYGSGQGSERWPGSSSLSVLLLTRQRNPVPEGYHP